MVKLERPFLYGTRIFYSATIVHRFRVDYTTVMRWIRTDILETETIREGRRNRYRIKKATIEAIETPLPPPGFV